MFYNQVTKNLKKAKFLPTDSNWLKENKRNLFAFVNANPISAQEFEISDLKLRPVYSALLLVFGLIILGSGITLAAKNSLPQDLLYPVKLATEKLEGMFVIGADSRAYYAMSLASKRLEEAQISLIKQSQRSELDATFNNYSLALREAQKSLEDVEALDNNDRKVKDVADKIVEIQNRHQQILANLASSSDTSNVSFKAVTDAQIAAFETEAKADKIILKLELKKQKAAKKQPEEQSKNTSDDFAFDNSEANNKAQNEITLAQKSLTVLENKIDSLDLPENNSLQIESLMNEFSKLIDQAQDALDHESYLVAYDKAVDAIRFALFVKNSLHDLRVDLKVQNGNQASGDDLDLELPAN